MITAVKISSTSLPPFSSRLTSPSTSGSVTLEYRNRADLRRSGIPSFSLKASGLTSMSTDLSLDFKRSRVDLGDKSPAYPPYVQTRYRTLQISKGSCGAYEEKKVKDWVIWIQTDISLQTSNGNRYLLQYSSHGTQYF